MGPRRGAREEERRAPGDAPPLGQTDAEEVRVIPSCLLQSGRNANRQYSLCSKSICICDIHGLFGLIFPHKMTLHHSELEEPINPGFRKTITNFEADDAPQNHNQLHLVNGVIVPCMLHMMGILFFLRITWAVGVTGWVSTLG